MASLLGALPHGVLGTERTIKCPSNVMFIRQKMPVSAQLELGDFEFADLIAQTRGFFKLEIAGRFFHFF